MGVTFWTNPPEPRPVPPQCDKGSAPRCFGRVLRPGAVEVEYDENGQVVRVLRVWLDLKLVLDLNPPAPTVQQEGSV